MKGPGLNKGGISSVLREGLQKRSSVQIQELCQLTVFEILRANLYILMHPLSNFWGALLGGKHRFHPSDSWPKFLNRGDHPSPPGSMSMIRSIRLSQSYNTETLPDICRICLV